MRKNLGSAKSSVSKTRHRKTLAKSKGGCDERDLTRDVSHGELSELGSSFQSLSAIAPTPVEWIWEGVIPRGKLVLIVGTPGVGKSLVALQVAAMVTLGWRTPLIRSTKYPLRKEAADPDGHELVEGEAADRHASDDVDMNNVLGSEVAGDMEADDAAHSERLPGSVVLVTSADDGVADTIRPRRRGRMLLVFFFLLVIVLWTMGCGASRGRMSMRLLMA